MASFFKLILGTIGFICLGWGFYMGATSMDSGAQSGDGIAAAVMLIIGVILMASPAFVDSIIDSSQELDDADPAQKTQPPKKRQLSREDAELFARVSEENWKNDKDAHK